MIGLKSWLSDYSVFLIQIQKVQAQPLSEPF